MAATVVMVWVRRRKKVVKVRAARLSCAARSRVVMSGRLGFEQRVIEGLFRLVDGEATKATCGSEEGPLGLHAGVGLRAGSGRRLPEVDHGAEIGGVGCGAAGEQARELEAFELGPEEEHGEDSGESAEAGHAHADRGEVPVAEVGKDHEDDGGR